MPYETVITGTVSFFASYQWTQGPVSTAAETVGGRSLFRFWSLKAEENDDFT